MSDITQMAIAAWSVLAKKAEPKLIARLKERGVASPAQLEPAVARQIFFDCLVATAAEHFPDSNIDALKHGLTALASDEVQQSILRLRNAETLSTDAFGVAVGVDAAIALAAFGLPVAPFDRKQPRILEEPTTDIALVAKHFGRWKSAYVGYSPCDVPFYMIITDCLRSMRQKLLHHAKLEQIRTAIARSGQKLPDGPFASFQHGLLLFAREPGDALQTIMLNDPNPDSGSVAVYAGWKVNDIRYGAPNQGFLPVPAQFLWAALNDPEIAMWIWRPVGIRTSIH